ncbi:MAG: hypothetical protein JWN78_1388 [Bacteroidota bacterium]|nr:hypothetical protein [Bacteroidota bacterium]
MKYCFTYILLILCASGVFAQKEATVPLQFHPKVNNASNAEFLLKKSHHRMASLTLPFFDDFYQKDIFPDPSLWQDNFVYINTTYPRYTVTVGVATFDGTDATGRPYSNALNVKGPADKLTSNPIDLSGLTSDSSVFLSFFYLAGEYGESPTAPDDSFTVQFLDTAGNWNIMWKTTVTVDSLTGMRQVFLKVDSIYLNANFQFRFQSYGSLSGANDTWHIDYVKLDKNRDTAAETNIREMAYEFLPPSLLKNYYVMPYNQFDSTELADTVSVVVRNNFINATTDIVDFYEATVVNTGANIASFNGPSRDFFPLTENIISYPKFNIPSGLTDDTIIIKVDYHFDVSAEAGEPAKVLANNAVTHNQVFSNFFAYDDGSPERGYWVTGLDHYKMAVKYGMRNPDTLQAIKFQLFPVKGRDSLALFSMCIWKNFTRNTVYTENDLIYIQSNLKVQNLIREFGVDTLNGYYYVPIDPQFLVNGATFPLIMQDTFAIGLIVENQESLIVGFDRNNNRSQYNFFVDGVTKWRESDLPGTMIINPVVGKTLPDYLRRLVPVKEIRGKDYNVKVYPNPARDQLFIEGIQDNSLVEIYTVNGSLVSQSELSSSGYINVRNLPSATYVIKITDRKTNQTGTSKFIKSE